MVKKINNLSFFESFLQSFELSTSITINVATTILSETLNERCLSTSTRESISILSNWIHNAFYLKSSQNSSKPLIIHQTNTIFHDLPWQDFFNFYLVLEANSLGTRLHVYRISDKMSVYISYHGFIAIEDRNPVAL